jgi:hypothetical protein
LGKLELIKSNAVLSESSQRIYNFARALCANCTE